MPLDMESAKELKQMIKLARSNALNFALVLGKKPEDTAILMHRKMAGDVLVKKAKKAPGVEPNKNCQGTVSVNGSYFELTCMTDPPAGIVKKLKAFFKASQISLKPKVLGPDGAQFEADESPEEQGQDGDQPPEQTPQASEDQSLLKALTKRAKGMQAEIAELEETAKKRLMKSLAQVAAAIKDGQAAQAEDLLDMLAQDLEEAKSIPIPPQPPEPPEPGGDPDGDPDGDPVNPLAERWRATADKLIPHIEKALASGKGDPGKIRAVWSFAKEKADGGDYGAALKSLGPLSTLLSQAAEAEKSQAETEIAQGDDTRQKLEAWEAVKAKYEPLVQEVIKARDARSTKVAAAWDMALKAASTADFDKANTIVGRLRDALDLADEDAGEEDQAEQAGGDAGEDAPDPGKAQSLEKLARAKGAYTQLEGQINAFGDPKPDDWATAMTQAAAHLAVDTSKWVEEIEAAVDAATALIEDLAPRVAKLTVEKQNWLKQEPLMVARLNPIQSHATKDRNAIKNPLKALEDEIAEAQAEAAAFKFNDASGRIGVFLTKADELEAKADDFAHCLAVANDRKKLADPLRTWAHANAKVQEAAEAVFTAYDNAIAKAQAGKYDECLELLSKVPALEDKAQLLRTRARQVEYYEDKLTPALATLNGLPEAVKMLLGGGIKRVQDAYDANKTGAEDDLFKAAEALTLARREALDLVARGEKAKAYVDFRETFDAKLREFKNHDGHEGIDDVITCMENDSTSAASDSILRKFDSATRILKTTEAGWPAAKTRADDYLAYKKKRDEVEERLKTLRGHDDAGTAGSELAVCDGHLRQGATVAATRDYKVALDSINSADKAADVVEKLLGMRAEMGDLKKGITMPEPAADTDIESAIAAYDELEKYVAQKDGSNEFTKLRSEAADAAKDGRDLAAGDAPDGSTIKGHLDRAAAILDGVVEKLACKETFTTQLDDVKPVTADELAAESTANDACIDSDITEIDRLVEQAENAVKTPDFDYPAGLARINEALTAIQDARKKLALYKEAKPIKAQIATLKRSLERSRDRGAAHVTPDHPIDAKHSLQIEIDKVEKFVTDFDSDWAGGDHKSSVSKLKENHKRAVAYEAVRKDYESLLKRRKLRVYDRENLIKDIPLVASEWTAMEGFMQKSDDYFEQRAFKSAIKMRIEAGWAIDRGKDILDARDAYELSRAAALTRVEAAEAAGADITSSTRLTEQIAALRTRYTQAHDETDVAKRNFAAAKREMDALPAECQAAIDAAAAYKVFEDARKTAETEIQKVKDDPNNGLVQPLIARLDGKYANALALAEAGNMNQARALVDVIPQDCNDAQAAARNNAALAEVSGGLAGVDDADTDAIRDAVEKVREVFDTLRWESEAEYADQANTDAEKAVEAAEALLDTDPAGAKAALPAAIAACERLQVEIDHHKQLGELATRTIARITSVTAPYEKHQIIKEDADALKQQITTALETARKGGSVDTGSAQIEDAMQKHRDLLIMAERHEKVLADRVTLDGERAALMSSPHRYAIRGELERISGLLEQAGAAAENRDHDTAEKCIAEAKAARIDAQTKAKMAANQPPEVDDIKAILARPDGDKELDKMIEGLDASVQRKVMRVAFQAKFGCDLNIYKDLSVASKDRDKPANLKSDGSRKGPNVRRFYEIMSVLPPKDTRDNESMAIFGYGDRDSSGASSYNSGKKAIVMREGVASTSGVYGFGQPNEVGEVDKDCEPADDKQVDFFTWNTLHEVGHAVDDQRSYMKGKEGQSGWAGWKQHGSDIKPVAEAIAGYYDFDVGYTIQYISGVASPPIPEAPGEVDPVEWERRRTKVHAHVDMARAGNNPWKSAVIAAKLNINGRVYHESYESGTWNSYEFVARKQAITGYQFRAPGEWFSELYAAFHSKKLKPKHPAVDWLSGLK